MGKHLWRKHSYVRVEKENPGCVWTLFRILNYHNVKRMLPYKKQKPQGRNSTSKEKPNQSLQEDIVTMYSTPVDSSSFENDQSVGKKSSKGRVESLMSSSEGEEHYKTLDLAQQAELQSLEEDRDSDHHHLNSPTLLSLLKTAPKLIKKINSMNEASSRSFKAVFAHKDLEEDYVDVLELFKVNQGLFVGILEDNPVMKKTKKKRVLAKSGTFPSRSPSKGEEFGRMMTSKIESKHNEVWPEVGGSSEVVKRAKSSRKMGRSSSLKESLDRYGRLVDANGVGSDEVIRKGLSRSLKLANEKEYGMLGYSFGRRSFSERLTMLEAESFSVASEEAPRAGLERLNSMIRGQGSGLRLDSPRDFGGSDCVVSSGEVEPGTEEMQETSDEIISASAAQECSVEERGNAECVVTEDAGDDFCSSFPFENAEKIRGPDDSIGHPKGENEMDISGDYNEDFQYVKHVLDVLGLTSGEDQMGAWHLPDQVLDPALFDGIEVCCPFSAETSGKDANAILSSSHRKLLFDLINEALVDMYEKSYSYYPKALSSGCRIRPAPEEGRVVEGVWGLVRKWLSWRPEMDPSLDRGVGHELSRNRSGWRSLQIDSELVVVDLEDVILDELLDEIVYSSLFLR